METDDINNNERHIFFIFSKTTDGIELLCILFNCVLPLCFYKVQCYGVLFFII